jgi:hypothetical protein
MAGGTVVAPGAAANLAALAAAAGETAQGPAAMNSPAAIAAAVARAEAARPLYIHKVPIEVPSGDDPIMKVGLVKLTPGEELMASERAGNNQIGLAYELAKESLRLLETAKTTVAVRTFDGSADRLWEKFDPQLRNLLVSAYGKHHSPTKEVTERFLAEFEIRV